MSNHTPRDQYDAALKILRRSYLQLMDQVVEDILRHQEEIDQGAIGSAENIINRHCHRLAYLSCLYANIRQKDAVCRVGR